MISFRTLVELWAGEKKRSKICFGTILEIHPFNSQKAAPTVSAARSHQSGAVDLITLLTAKQNQNVIFCPVGQGWIANHFCLRPQSILVTL